ncbi:hypothetical protein [Nitrospira sp. Nam80]
MRYIVSKAVLAPTPEVEISAEEYSLLGTARGVLSSALAIEEKYEILIANFLALETQLLNVAATNAVRNTLTYSGFFEIRSALNVHVVNLLTAARLYLDQLPQDVADCLPENADAADRVKARCSKEYDEHFEYRFMEALRNHVQHRGIPIHFVRQNAQWTSIGEDGRMEFTVDIAAQRRYLEEDEKFKKAILDEIASDVDLKAACRRYVESLSVIHEFARNLIAEAAKSARARLESVHKRYAEVYSEKLIGLTASAMDDGREISSVPLLLDWDDVRLELQKRNSQLVNLHKRYVTGRALKDKK